MKKTISAIMLLFGMYTATNAQESDKIIRNLKADISNGIVNEFQNSRGFVPAPFISYQPSANASLETSLGTFSASYFGNYYFENNSINKLKEWESDVFLSYKNVVIGVDFSIGSNFIHANRLGWLCEADASLSCKSFNLHGFYEFNSNGGGIEAGITHDISISSQPIGLKAEAIINFKYYTSKNQLAGMRITCDLPIKIDDNIYLRLHAKHLFSVSNDFSTNISYGASFNYAISK